MSGEFEFIRSLRDLCPVRPPVLVGIGDDAAVLDQRSDRPQVITTDMLMEKVDFILEETTPELIGRKSLAVNLSDLAAMGAQPTAVFVSLALPRHQARTLGERLFAGIRALAEEFEVTIAGGDTNTWDGPLVCSLTAVGTCWTERPVLRSGARPGDAIVVTGAFGGSLAGRHLTFTPRLAEARQLLQMADVHAMIDVSDGLAADLHHLLEESRVGAVLREATIPIHADVTAASSSAEAMDHALGDGEDFELIFTMPADQVPRLLTEWPLSTPLNVIGEIVPGAGCELEDGDGRRSVLPAKGWVHLMDDGGP